MKLSAGQRFLSALILAPMMVADVLAEEGVPAALAKTTIEPGSADQILKVTLGLGLIVALIFLIAWLARHFGHLQFGGNDQFKVVSSLAVGQRERLVVVEVGGEQILVGVAPGRVSKIHELKDHIETAGKSNAPASLFANKFKQALKGRDESQ